MVNGLICGFSRNESLKKEKLPSFLCFYGRWFCVVFHGFPEYELRYSQQYQCNEVEAYCASEIPVLLHDIALGQARQEECAEYGCQHVARYSLSRIWSAHRITN